MTLADAPADLGAASAVELARALRERRIGALEATDAAIARIEARDGAVNAVVVRDFERSRQAARAADAALARGEAGALLGVPMTVKEAFDVEGLPTTWGVPDLAGHRALQDAVCVARLKAAGAVILGKTNVAYMLADWQSDNRVYGRSNHPRDAGRTPGGSSGGSAAAVAAGMVPLEFGSDIGGSIRVPSSFCGVYGHKPSYGLVPPDGHAPGGQAGAAPVFNVVGPIARTPEDLALALEITAGPEGLDAKGYRARLSAPRRDSLNDLRVLILDSHPSCATDGEIKAALEAIGARLEEAGSTVSRRHEGLPDLQAAHRTYRAMLGAAMSKGAGGGGPVLSLQQWMAGLDHQQTVRRQWEAVFEEVDVVVAPCFGVPAFPHDDAPFETRSLTIDGVDTVYGDQLAWPGVATFPHLPATAAPIGQTKGGLPIGAQIIGGYLEDRTTLAVAGLIGRL